MLKRSMDLRRKGPFCPWCAFPQVPVLHRQAPSLTCLTSTTLTCWEIWGPGGFRGQGEGGKLPCA
jgi:hypothetical protein